MRCRTISLDMKKEPVSSVAHHGSMNAKQVEDAVNTALEAIEAEGNRIVSAHMLGSKLGPGEVATIGKAMLMILFEPNEVETAMPYAGVKEAPIDCTPTITCGNN